VNELKRKLAVAGLDTAKYRNRCRARKHRLKEVSGNLEETKSALGEAHSELGESKLHLAQSKDDVAVIQESLAQVTAESGVMQSDLARSERALANSLMSFTSSNLELERCQFVSKRLSDAQLKCWFCKESIMEIDMGGLDDNTPIADGKPLQQKMQCNGGHSICAACSAMMAEHFINDKQEKRLCCGFLTSWPGNKLSRRCNKLYCPQQMSIVLPAETVTEVVTQSVLRKERAEVASETLSRRDDAPITKSDKEDDMFTFKTPCCNIAWEADACMAVRCPGCERRFCQLCSRRMEMGMTSLQAHDHVRQCTLETFNRAFVFPYEIEKKILPKRAVHLAMKANYSKMYQLQNFGEERLQHWNLAPAAGEKGHIDVTRMTHAERREALEVKIVDVVNNPLAAMANANYNVRWDDVEGEEAQRAAAAAVEIGVPPNPVQEDHRQIRISTTMATTAIPTAASTASMSLMMKEPAHPRWRGRRGWLEPRWHKGEWPVRFAPWPTRTCGDSSAWTRYWTGRKIHRPV